MGLPVLRLPFLAFDNIYQSLDVADKILLSQCSRRVQDLVRSQERPWAGRQISIYFFRESTVVKVLRRNKDCFFTLYLMPVSDRELTDEKSFFNLNIDGTTWDVNKCPPSTMGEWYCISEEGRYEKDVLIIVRMLRNLFNCSIFRICLKSTNVNFQNFFVETDDLHRADKIHIDEGGYDARDMDFMFDHFVADFLDFRGYGGPEYRYRKPLNFPKIFLAHATWVDLEKVLEMTKTSKHFSLCEAKLIGDGDINQFIKWWLSSDGKTLEILTITRGQGLDLPQPSDVELRMNRSGILEGIKSTPGKKKREEITKHLSHINWENGVDIIRKDGVRATVLLDHSMSFDVFFFAVWYHPNPDVEEATDN